MDQKTGALPPPGAYDGLHAVGKKLQSQLTFMLGYDLVAGFNGMAVGARFPTEETATMAAKQFGGSQISQDYEIDGVTHTITAWVAEIDGVEVLFTFATIVE